MTTIEQLEAQIMTLPDGARANLASYILQSLPATYIDDDDGDAEALRRDEEMDRDPSASLTLAEFKQAMGR